MFSDPCSTLLQMLPTVPQAQMFTNLMIFEAIVKIISRILIASGTWVELVGRQKDPEHTILSLLSSWEEEEDFSHPCVIEDCGPREISSNDGTEPGTVVHVCNPISLEAGAEGD